MDDLVNRLGKFSNTKEEQNKKIISNAKERQEEKKKLIAEIEKMKAEIDPYLIKDDAKIEEDVKVEVENALLIIMDKKIKAEQEVEELKKLLRERNRRIYELEQENKELKDRNWELEDIMKGGTGRVKRSVHENINIGPQSQDGEGFDRADEEPVYDNPPSQDDEDDFWQEGKGNKANYGNDNNLWIMGNKETTINNTPIISSQPAGGKSLPKRPQGYNAKEELARYGVGAKK